MTRLTQVFAAALVLHVFMLAGAAQSVYPTGTTIFDPDRTWNGFTVLSPLATQAVLVIDMNGNVVKRWEGFNNSAGGPARVFPGGLVMAAAGARPPHQESLELVRRDFAGNVLWRFAQNEQIKTREGETISSARQHHDWQLDTFPAGYYSPEGTPTFDGASTLVLAHTNRTQPKVADVVLEDDRLIELSPDGKVTWEWVAGDHIDELGFAADARAVIKAAAAFNKARGSYDWLHVNSATYLGPNRWFDAGDKRFAPNHVIISSREASLLAIVGRDGSIVWRMGPDFSQTKELRAIRQIIGQHHAHFIPKGLPGAGNLLVFDNGGSSGYGFANPLAPDGRGAFARATSRVLEINPVTLELVWSYTNPRFFSTNISGAQRLPNGNTLITAGAGGRMFEVTREGAIVWEYMFPLFSAGPNAANAVYRAYRVPYSWIPQLTAPKELRVTPPAAGDFRLPAAAAVQPVRSVAQTAAEPATTMGSLPDGTAYRIDVPPNWNGTVLIGLDYAAAQRPSLSSAALLARGYAMAGTTRLVTGWDVTGSMANQLAVLDLFAKQHQAPARVYVLGSSLGAHTGAATIQAHPERFQGAVLMCGGLAGAVGLWDSKLDAVFVAKTLLAPADPTLPVTGIPANFADTARPSWLKALSAAQQTPQGRARIALAAVVGQLPSWSDPRKPQPDPGNLAAVQAGLYDSLAGGPLPVIGQAMSSRHEIERRSGGNISSNTGVDYSDLLTRSGQANLIATLYRQANLDLQADLAALARAPRVSADAQARSWVAPGVWNGRLAVPVITVNGIGDNISPVAGQDAYQRVVDAAGSPAMLRQTYTNTAGHCGFSAAETVAAVEALQARVMSGRWGETSAEAMNAAARAAGGGEARFIAYTPAVFLRPFAAR